MDYDVLILGGGLVGCAVAYELSKYSLNIALIEKDYDIVDDVAQINSSIVFNGLQCEDNTMAKLQQMGNDIIEDLVTKFNISYKKCNSMIISQNKKQTDFLNKIYLRSLERTDKGVCFLDSESAYKLEPKLNINVDSAIYSENIAIISPYNLGLAYGEIAFDNGVSFKLEEIVEDINKISRGFKVVTNKNKFTCRMVINTTPEDYNIDGFKDTKSKENGYLKYFLVNKEFGERFKSIIFTYNENNELICMHPTVEGNYIISIRTKDNANFKECFKRISSVIQGLKQDDINGFYESVFYNDIMAIDDTYIDKGYIRVVGKNFAEVTMAPSIAKIIRETVEGNLKCKLKSDFNDKVREKYRFRYMTNEERNKLISLDKKYGKIICTCNLVTEGEIVDAIRRPLGARTVEGIKRRTGAGSGNCKGTQCMHKIISILARETNKRMTDIVKDSKNSKILLNRIKEFDEI